MVEVKVKVKVRPVSTGIGMACVGVSGMVENEDRSMGGERENGPTNTGESQPATQMEPPGTRHNQREFEFPRWMMGWGGLGGGIGAATQSREPAAAGDYDW